MATKRLPAIEGQRVQRKRDGALGVVAKVERGVSPFRGATAVITLVTVAFDAPVDAGPVRYQEATGQLGWFREFFKGA